MACCAFGRTVWCQRTLPITFKVKYLALVYYSVWYMVLLRKTTNCGIFVYFSPMQKQILATYTRASIWSKQMPKLNYPEISHPIIILKGFRFGKLFFTPFLFTPPSFLFFNSVKARKNWVIGDVKGRKKNCTNWRK